MESFSISKEKFKMKYILSILCVITYATFNSNKVLSQNDKSTPFFEKGLELYKSRDYSTAESLLREGLKYSPNNSLGHFYLGKVIQAQRPSDAEVLKEFKTSYAIDEQAPHAVEVFTEISRIERKQSQERLRQEEIGLEISNKIKFFNSLSGLCQQITPNTTLHSGVICVCFSGSNNLVSINNKSIKYNITSKGTSSAGSSRASWWTQTESTCRLDDILKERSTYDFASECVSKSHPSSWFINEFSSGSPVRFYGKEANGGMPAYLKFDVGAGLVKIGGLVASPGCNLK